MKLILKYIKNYRLEAVLAPLFKMLEAIFELFVPLVIASIIDTGIAKSDYYHLTKCAFMLLILAIIGLSASITAQYFSAKAAIGVSTAIRHDLFSHIQSFSFSKLDELGSSTLITRMTSDINQVQNGVNMTLRLFLRSPFVVFGAMIMAFTIDVKAALIFVVTIPILTIIVYGIMLATIPMYKRVQSLLDAVLLRVRENLTGVRVIRAFAGEDAQIREFTKSNDELNLQQKLVGKISALTNPLTFIVVNAATLILLYTGAIQVDNSILTQGQVVALINYMSQILIELVKLANLIVTITKALACAGRVQSVFDVESGMEFKEADVYDTNSDPAIPVVSFDNVSLSYNGGEEALTDISFSVKKGQSIGVIGGTGSGKSSLVNLIPRFYDATKGSVKVDGIDVKDYPEDTLREKIGIVQQKAVLFRGTIAENLKWGNNDATTQDLKDALICAQAWDFVSSKEGVLDFMIEQGGKNLSGGQRQRLSIARALVRKPEILILDDSSSALDYATDAALRKAISELSCTTFIVSQRTVSLRGCDFIVVLEDGDMVAMGTHDQLLDSCEIYREIHESQYKDISKN